MGSYPRLTWEPVSGFEPLACRYKKYGVVQYALCLHG